MLGKLNCQISFQGYKHNISLLFSVFNLALVTNFPLIPQTTSTVGVLLQNLIKKTGWNILLEVGSNKVLGKLIGIMTKSFQRLSQIVWSKNGRFSVVLVSTRNSPCSESLINLTFMPFCGGSLQGFPAFWAVILLFFVAETLYWINHPLFNDKCPFNYPPPPSKPLVFTGKQQMKINFFAPIRCPHNCAPPGRKAAALWICTCKIIRGRGFPSNTKIPIFQPPGIHGVWSWNKLGGIRTAGTWKSTGRSRCLVTGGLVNRLVFGIQHCHLVRNWLVRANLSSRVEGQHNGDLDSKHSLPKVHMSNGTVHINFCWVPRLKKVPISELHGLGTLSS